MLREHRKSAKLTQKQLAAKLGVVQSVVSDWERGEKPIPDDRINQLADVLKLSPDELEPEARFIRGFADIYKWRREAALHRGLDQAAKLILVTLPAWLEEPVEISNKAFVRPEQLAEALDMDLATVKRSIPAVYASPFVERYTEVDYGFRLKFPKPPKD